MAIRKKISVLLPTFNNSAYLSTAIESILNQTYTNFELIIINDGSNDNTEYILSSYQSFDSRIKVINNKRNLGVANSLNLGINESCGEFIARMDGDDISTPTRFEMQINFLEENPEISILGSRVDFIDEYSEKLPDYPWIIPEKHNDIAWRLLFSTPICHPTIIMRKSVFSSSKSTFYDPHYKNEDMHLWSKLIFETKMHNLQEILLHYRMGINKNDTLNKILPTQIRMIAKEYIEKIIDSKVTNRQVALIFSIFSRKGYLEEKLGFLETIEITKLLTEIFQQMFIKGVFKGNISYVTQRDFFAALDVTLSNNLKFEHLINFDFGELKNE